MEKMRGVYREAKSYTDNATVVFHAVVRSTGGEVETPFTRTSVAFERPNKLHVTYTKNISSPEEERYEVVSNGVVVRSSAKEIPLQIHEAIAPLELSAENFIPEPALRGAVLENGIENTLPQVALLLESDKERTVFPGEDQARTLADAELDGIPYHRLELPSPEGKRVLWIDPQRFTLRRMEIPIDDQREQINDHNQYTKFSLWIDFDSVMLDPEIESATFQLALPEKARRVRRFIPPPPAGPPEFLGKPVGPFSFATLDGEEVTPETLAGKVVVLDFWFTNCPPCKAQTPVLNQVYEHFKDSGDVAFYAVSTDSRVVDNEVVAKTLLSWGGHMPLVRDLRQTGNRILNVRKTPSLLLIDRESRLQTFQVGFHQTPEPLIKAIERLVDGEDIPTAEREKYAQALAKYEQTLDAATIEDPIVP
ncbi:MAG: redoxin domain-containing protein [Planctomycetes bacterium]|nr:redoxin domain-containing protein [Planctomycetota bacterium]